MEKTCKICGGSFQSRTRKVCCSDSCTRDNDLANQRAWEKNAVSTPRKRSKDFSEDTRIPLYLVERYGIDFLRENPMVVETLQASTRLSTSNFKFLTEDEKQVRVGARLKYRFGYIKCACDICGEEFSKNRKGTLYKTCGPVCCEERKRRLTNEACARSRMKSKINGK